MLRFMLMFGTPFPREKCAKEVDERDRDRHCEQDIGLAHRHSLPYGRGGPAYTAQRPEDSGSDP